MRIPLCPAIDLEPGDELSVRYESAREDLDDDQTITPMIVIRLRRAGRGECRQLVSPRLVEAAVHPEDYMAQFFQIVQEEFEKGTTLPDAPESIGILDSEG